MKSNGVQFSIRNETIYIIKLTDIGNKIIDFIILKDLVTYPQVMKKKGFIFLIVLSCNL